MRKSCLALVLSLALLPVLAACGPRPAEAAATTAATAAVIPATSAAAAVVSAEPPATEPATSLQASTAPAGTAAATQTQTSTAQQTTLPGDPYSLNSGKAAEVLALYQKVGKANEATKCRKTMVLDGQMEGTGMFGSLLKLGSGIINSTLKKNSVEFDGLPGKYKTIQAGDWTSASAKDNGDGTTTIRFSVKNQTDDAFGKKYEGSVGRSIMVLDGVKEALEELSKGGMKATVNGPCELKYRDAAAVVKFDNKTGLLRDGEWHYFLDARIKDATAFSVVHVDELWGTIKYTVVNV